ncbi:MAG: stage II sporulation protein P [Clostridia bacterium]|nr:stage II sporulation protein P [Clostridia bacterium]
MKRLVVCLFAIWMIFSSAQAEEKVYTITDEAGEMITQYIGLPEKGDEYISHTNVHYVVESVDEKAQTAVARRQGTYQMPSVEWLRDGNLTQPVSGRGQAVAIYCTHSDESYEPNDGTHSETPRGSIYDVAEALKANFEKLGVTVYYDNETHHPHDSGAYKRSRATAEGLLKHGVDAIFDIHRDGIEDPNQYKTTIEGKEGTMVRLLVGRSNQNSAENKAFAVQIKAVADELYPELIRDIYIGKGTYNQDLSPNSVLLEFGTHTLDKDLALRSTEYMAETIQKTLYGGVSGSAKSGATVQTNTKERDKGAWSGIGWIIGGGIAAAIVFAIVSTGRLKPAMEKVKDGAREMTGGLFGKKKDK